MPKSKYEPRYGVMENFDKRTDTKLVERLFNPVVSIKKESRQVFEDVSLDVITPRSINRYPQRGIEMLARSIEKTGGRLIYPIVLVHIKDLPEDSAVLEEYKNQGVDINSLDLIIVAGERRYRAFRYLQSLEAERIKGVLGAVNKYDKITANILTKEEAQNEETFYEDSNTQARQVSGLVYVEIALEDLKSRLAGGEDEKVIIQEMAAYNSEKYPVTQRLSKARYCMYFLDKEFGDTDSSERTILRQTNMVEKCVSEVKDAVINLKITAQVAELIMKWPKEDQLSFIRDIEDGGDAVLRERVEDIKAQNQSDKLKKKKKKTTKYSSATTNKQTKKILKDQKPGVELLREMVSSLGGENRAVYDKIVKSFDRCRKEVEGLLDQLD